MKFGFMTLDFKRLPLEHVFKLGREYGFDGVEIFCNRNHLFLPGFTAEKARAIRELKKKYDLETPMLTPNTLGKEVNICSSDPEERRDGITLLKQGIDAAEMIEAPQMLVTADHPGYFREREKIWSVLVESMAEICDYACGKGVRVVMEPVTPMESPVVTTSQDCSRLIRDVNSPALYAMLDIVPPVVVHEPFSQYFELLGDRLSYIHICNTDGVTDAHIRLETGVYPIPDVINVFKHHRYEGYVTTELYSENYRDPELLLANTSRVLRGIREEIKV